MKREVIEIDGFDGTGGRVRVFRVTEPSSVTRFVEVWWAQGQARCVNCQGALSAMLTTCVHAGAVRRRMVKEGGACS